MVAAGHAGSARGGRPCGVAPAARAPWGGRGVAGGRVWSSSAVVWGGTTTVVLVAEPPGSRAGQQQTGCKRSHCSNNSQRLLPRPVRTVGVGVRTYK